MAEPSAKRFVALDVEVTGLDPSQAEIIDIGLVAFDRGGVRERFSSLVQPKGEVPLVVQNLTGISPEDLAGAPGFAEVSEQVKDFIGDALVVGQSVEFDLAHLRAAGIYPGGASLDTFHLASIFLPGRGSYRLESIATALEVELTEAHRALADAEATAEVFLRLLSLIEERVDPELGGRLGSILGRSRYGLKEVWGNLSFQGSRPYRPEGITPDKLEDPDPGAVAFIRQALQMEGGRVVGVARPRTRLAAALGEALQGERGGLLVAVPSLRAAEALARRVGVPLVLSGEHYLSKSRALAYLETPKFSETQAVFALKLAYFLSWTEEGRRDELSLYDVEYHLWRLLACRKGEADEPFLPKRGDGVAVTNHRSLSEVAEAGRLVVSDFQLLDEVLGAAAGVTIDQRDGELFSGTIRSAFDLMLGLAGIVLENFSEPSQYGRQLRLRPPVLKSKQWGQFTDAARHFREISGADVPVIERELLLRTQEELGRLLEGAECEIAWLAERYESLVLRLVPASTGPLLEELFGRAETVTLFTKSIEGVPEGFTRLGEEASDDPQVLVVRSGGRSEVELLGEVLQGLDESDRRVAVFCSSASMIRDLFDPISGALSREVVATGFSGSEMRLVELAREDAPRVVLAGPRLWTDDRLDEVFDVVIAPRLFFDPPSEPVHQARAETGGGFMGYSLPRSTARLRALAAKLRPGGCLVLLDQRLVTQRYGRALIQALDLPTKEVEAGEASLDCLPGETRHNESNSNEVGGG